MEAVKIYTKSVFTHEPVWDSSFKLIFVLHGELSIFVDSKERRLHVNDFTFITPFQLHGGSSAENMCKALIVDIGQDLWKTALPGADRLSFSINILRANDRLSAYSSICKSLAQIVYYSQLDKAETPARICRAVSDILAILTEDFAASQRSQNDPGRTMSRIQDILHYIVNNYSERFSLEDISRVIGFHPQYFSAYFKKQFGVSFIDFLNNYRVNKSIPLLRDTDESILSIALACGFNSHKTFSNAFEKYYQSTPRDYRKTLRIRAQKDTFDLNADEYNYLRRFWNSKPEERTPVNTDTAKCIIRIDNKASAFENTSHNFISIGRAISCLRSDMQKQIIRAQQDFNLEYVRIRDIFSDDLFVYFEDRNKTPVFSWRAVDEILDFLISAKLKPFIEIGYMPGQLASRKQYAGWQYHPNVSYPKSEKLWEMLVSSFINHLISRYSKETIESWLFDFWTSPNLRMEQGYWNESMDRFFRFYRLTYNAMRRSCPGIRFGSPNFSYPSGLAEYEHFFNFAKKNDIRPDFISSHLYSCGDGEDNPAQKFMEYSVFDNNYRIPNIKPGRDTVPDAIDALRDIIDKSAFSGLPIIIDDWNISFFPTDFTRDTCFMGPVVIENYFRSCRKIYGMGFASLSDIHEDFFNTDQMFNGGPGLLTYSGIPKSSYYAMRMAYRFTRHIIMSGVNYIVGRTDSGYEILVYNMDYYNKDYAGNDPSVISFTKRYNVFEEVPDLDCHIEMPADKGTYSIVRSMIGRNCGSSYDAWVKMGSPSDITPEISQYLSQISAPVMNYEMRSVSESILLDETLEPHSVLHILISRM